MGDGAECPGGTPSGRYGDGIIIAPEYKPAAADCRSPGASTPRFCGTTPHKCAKGGLWSESGDLRLGTWDLGK